MKNKLKAKAIISICTILILTLISGCDQVISDKEIWSYPVNYPEILDNAQKGDKKAQEEIATLIYKGVMRYPHKNDRKEGTLFYWLIQNDYDESFERKVARFFFTRGDWFDSKEILKEISIKAEQGDPYAQYAMGSCYFYTELGENSLKKAIEWYLKAANQGHAKAQMILAIRYLEYVPTQKNISEGMKWLKKASKSGLPAAHLELSHEYYKGESIEQNFHFAYLCLVLASEGGSIKAQCMLAKFHLDEIDFLFPITKNKDIGIKWLEKASNNCDVEAMSYCGHCYLIGKHVPLNRQKGLEILRKAAYLGSKDAIEILEKEGE